MDRVGKTQSGSLLVEMTEAEFEKLKSGSATNTEVFMVMRMTVKDCVDYCAGKIEHRGSKKTGGED